MERLAKASLDLWDVPEGASVRLINVSENTTYMIEAPGGFKAVLRVHRQNYHSHRAIECELAWIEALNHEKVVTTPSFFVGKNGDPIQSGQVEGLNGQHYMVLFHFIEGLAPDENGDMTEGFEELGAIAARCHEHVLGWDKPQNFERLVWDIGSVFSADATWGNWREAPEVTSDVKLMLEKVEMTIRARLKAYGTTPDRFNLIHADMRLANLLVNDSGTRLIDFDDCGHGWLMYDFAAATTFLEADPRMPDLKAAWVKGYRSVRDLSEKDENEIATFVLLRRMALLAWIGSHIEAPEPQEHAPGFAATTARLGQEWMDKIL